MDIVRRKPLSKGSTGDKISVKRFIPPKTSHLHYSHLKWTMCQGQERQMNSQPGLQWKDRKMLILKEGCCVNCATVTLQAPYTVRNMKN
ncbi:hypothetical protein RND81_06G084700 [Saponaria officinalis]|uniref:Uncharacterized protein n=1 Tax=Saponaria officinalis TaxID=3572 RepID=A0AAW1K8Q0_SAPOF